MRRLVVYAVALVASFLAGAAIGAIADAIIAAQDGRPHLAAGHRRALDEDWWTG